MEESNSAGREPFLQAELHYLPGRLATGLAMWVDRVLVHDRTLWFLVGIGWITRIAQYVANRALWSDEALLSLNIVQRSHSALLNQLDNFQYAPIGFLWIERSFVETFGNSEYTLRAFPLLCSLLSMLLFALVAKQTLHREAATFAAAFFALSENLIYYGSEVKQYSTDAMVTLALFLCSLWLLRKKTGLAFLIYALAGATLVWLSHPSVFVLAGMGLSVLFHFLVRREWKYVSTMVLVITSWLISFAVEYFNFLKEPVTSTGLRSVFAPEFLTIPTSFKELYTYAKIFFFLFQDIGFPLFGIAAMLFLLGFAAFWRQRSAGAWLALPPFLITAAVSLIAAYPLRGRLVIFLTPLVLLLMGAGAGLLWSRNRSTSPIVALVCLGLVFFHPVTFASYHLLRPRIRAELREVMERAREHMQPGDVLYAHYDAWPAFEYYTKERGLLREFEVVGGSLSGRVTEIEPEMKQIRGRKRIWFVFSYPGMWEMELRKPVFLAHVSRMGGKQVMEIEIANELQKSIEKHRSSASMCLYEFREDGPTFAK